jgi:hypothetical protein
MPSFFHQSGVIDHPSLDPSLLLHDVQHVVAHRFQNVFVTPGRMGNEVVEGLMGLPRIGRTETCGHRFHTIPFARK